MSSQVLSKSALALRPSVFAELAPRIAKLGSKCLPLHIGDTYRLPPEGVKASLASAASDPSSKYFHYSHPFGRPELLEALAFRLNREQGIEVRADNLQLTCGATQALATVAQSMLDPGQEVIVLCPFWPIIRGIVHTVGGKCIEADYQSAVGDPYGVLGPLLTERTKAIYFATPNNPDGYMLSQQEARNLHSFAGEHGLYLWCDEAYEHITFDGRSHFSMQSLDRGLEEPRVISVFTFSKSFAMAGLRIGYILAPKPIMEVMRRVCNHQVYSVSGLVQEAALSALCASTQDYDKYLSHQRTAYQQARDLLQQAFPSTPLPAGGAYLWVACASVQSARNTILAWLDRGVSSAPGEAFGAAYSHCIRLCFTSIPLERLQLAKDILLEVGLQD